MLDKYGDMAQGPPNPSNGNWFSEMMNGIVYSLQDPAPKLREYKGLQVKCDDKKGDD